MQRLLGVYGVLVLVLSLPCGALGQQPIRWQPTLESAKRLAVQTDRLVLIHFWADWCQPCLKMEREVFTDPGVVAAIQTHYVPVKVNADYFPSTATQYGVTGLPTDVIITPQGQLIDKIQGAAVAGNYIGQLQRVASGVKQGGRASYAQRPGVAPGGPPGPVAVTSGPPGPGPTDPRYAAQEDQRRRAVAPPGHPGVGALAPGNHGAPRYAGPQPTTVPPRLAGPQTPMAPPMAPRQQAPAQQPNVAGQQAPAGNPPLALDGHCPVQLSDDMTGGRQTWTLGDRRWGARHRGRTYLFAGPDQQRRFLANPDRYAPMLSGNDVVLAVEQTRTVAGHREHGVFFNERVFLFTTEATLQKFSRDPNRYAAWAVEAMQASHAGGYPGPRYR